MNIFVEENSKRAEGNIGHIHKICKHPQFYPKERWDIIISSIKSLLNLSTRYYHNITFLCSLVLVCPYSIAVFFPVPSDSIVLFLRPCPLRFSVGPLSHTLHLPLHHLHQLRQHPFYLLTLHLIVVEVHIVQEFITRLLIHVTTIASGNEGDGGKFTGILINIARPLGHRLCERYQNSANRRFLRFSVCPFPEGEGLQGEVEPL